MVLLNHHHSRNLSTDSQEVANKNNKMQRYEMGEVADDEYCDSIRSQGRLADCVFEYDDEDEDDEESIDSQALLEDDAIVQENDSNDDDDDISIVSQDASIDDADNDNSLSSMVSKALSVTASTSASCSESPNYDITASSSKKRVVFERSQDEIHLIPTRKEFTQEEKTKIWYQHSDMAAMRMARYDDDTIARQQEPNNNNTQILDSIPEIDSFPQELTSSSLTKSLKSPLHQHHLAGSFHRGTCKPTDEQSEARITAVMDAVMDEQETQWLDDDGIADPDRIAQASILHSRLCARDALLRAHLDALEAIAVYVESEDSDEVMDMTIRSERSSSMRTGKLRKDEEVYPLSPMSISPKARLTNRLRGRIAKQQQSKAVSESRWTPVSGKRATLLARRNSKPEDLSPTSTTASSNESSLAMPKRMASNHGAESSSSSIVIPQQLSLTDNNGLAMPKRLPSNHCTEYGLAMPRRRPSNHNLTMPKRMPSNHNTSEEFFESSEIVTNTEFSERSGFEFGDEEDYYNEQDHLAPPCLPIAPPPLGNDEDDDHSVSKESAKKTCKFFAKKDSTTTTESGIYHKVKRTLKGFKKTKKQQQLEEEEETKNKRKKKTKSTNKPKQKKAKATKPKDSTVTLRDEVDASQPSGLSDEFEQLDASCNDDKLIVPL